MSVARWRAGAVAVLLASVLPARGAYAQAAPPLDDADVTIIGGGSDVDSLVDTIRELMGRLGLALTAHVAKTATDVAPAPSARVVVEIDFTPPGEIVLSVRSDTGHAPGRRRIARDGSASVVREEVADAVSSMVAAQLMSGAAPDAGAARSETAEPPPPPSPAPPPALEPAPEAPPPAPRAPRPFAIDLTTFAGVGPFADDASVVGRLGGGIVLASRRGLRPSIALTGEGFLPFDSTTDGVVAHTSVGSVRAVSAIEILRLDSWLAIDVGAGFGFDVVSVDPAVPTGASAYPRTEADPVACASIAANFALTPGVVLTLMALGDVDLAPHSYVVSIVTGPGTSEDPLFAPWRVRPAALVGFTFTTFGDARFASRDPR
jgi:hypothetical protein